MTATNCNNLNISDCNNLNQGFPNWGSRPPKGSRNDLQGSQRELLVLQGSVKFV